MSTPSARAQYGAAAVAHLKGQLPNPFPRIMGPNALKYLQEVVDSGLTSGMVERFEAAFAATLGVKHCVATPGCTPALAILAAAFPGEPGDEIIVSPVTDYGTIQGLFRQGYIPVFADTDPGTVNLSAATIEPLISDRTRGLLCVHMTGLVCDMDPINALAARHGLFVYEDVCQALLSTYKGRVAGTLAQLEIVRENVATRDTMARRLTDLVNEIPGVQALPIPDYQEVCSCWMFGIIVDPAQFTCTVAEFGEQLAAAGIPGAGPAAYYLIPECCTFLEEYARAGRFPFAQPPAGREYHYGAAGTPVAAQFLQRFIRWSTICEKYTEEHCHIAAQIIRAIADANRA